MADAAGSRWARIMGIRYRPVVLSSPYPPDECLRRLAAVTTHRSKASWYLDTKTVGRPDPRFSGHIGPSRILITRWKGSGGRDGLRPWLGARLEPAECGGTTLTGKVGPAEGAMEFNTAFSVIAGLMAAGSVAAGVHLLITGHMAGLTAVLVAPLALAALITVLRTASLRLPERMADTLLREVSESFGLTDEAAGPAAYRA